MCGVGKYKGVVGFIGRRPSKVRNHMQLYGYNPSVKADLIAYAEKLECGDLGAPRELWGLLKVSKNKLFCWDRKTAFIAKHKYSVDFEALSKRLVSGFDFGKRIIKYKNSDLVSPVWVGYFVFFQLRLVFWK